MTTVSEEVRIGRMQSRSQRPKPKHPNPLLFVAVSALSFAAFYATLKYRSVHHPASAQPRQHDHPLVPPRHNDP